jgi:hypothetical protein
MRTTFAEATVRLYHLDDSAEIGLPVTLFYGPLSEAMQIAARQDEEVQQGLWLATDNDVVAWLDLAEG